MDRTNEWTPAYHFHAPEAHHYPFDPNGCIFWKGRYHVFYLFQDPETAPGSCCWGHASSPDLVNWDFHPTALACDQPGETHMFSGCALLTREGRPALVYHSVAQGTSVAFAEDDDLIHWRKAAANPVIREPSPEEPEFLVYHVFDPHVWVENDQYYAILGAQAKPYREYDTAYLFRSPDLIHWEYCRPFYQATDHFCERYDDCACPDFFRLGNQWVLLCISHARGARYYLGDYIANTFVPRSHHWLNFPGGNQFAPETLLDGKNRRIAWFWLASRFEENLDMPPMREVWALPREFRPSPDGSGILQFVPGEFEQLCGTPQPWAGEVPVPGGTMQLPFRSRCCKLELDLTLRSGCVEFDLLASENGDECLKLIIDRNRETVALDHERALFRQRSSPYIVCARKAPDDTPRRQELEWKPGEDNRYKMDIYLDRCVAEVFSADGRYAATQLVANAPTSDRMAIRLSPDADAVLESLVFRPMKAARMK